jgi:hypothetical protein
VWMLHYADAPFSMTRQCHSKRQRGIHSWMLHFVQHDRQCHSKRQRGIHSWMLYGVQRDKAMSFQAIARNPLMDALRRSAGQIEDGTPHPVLASPKRPSPCRRGTSAPADRVRSIHSWMLHFVQHDKTEKVMPNTSGVSKQVSKRIL